MSNRIQSVQIDAFWDAPIYCPFCGQGVVLPEAAVPFQPCSHTLFIANDEGFGFRHQRFNDLMDLSEAEPEIGLDIGEEGIDGFTSRVALRDSVKFVSYSPSPGGMAAYVGFAPLDR